MVRVMSDPHLSLRQAADYVSDARDDIDTGGLNIEGENS